MALTEVPIELSSTPGIIDNSTGTAITIDSSNNTNFADNTKAIFGAGSDLQIYHDGTDSIISEFGAGSLDIRGTNVDIKNAAGTEYCARFITNDKSSLYYDGSEKLATTATGIDVTGTVTADSAVFGTTSESSTIVYLTSSTTGESELRLGDTDTDAGSIAYTNSDDTLTFRAAAAARMTLNSTGLDVTGTVTADGLTVDDVVSIDTSTGNAFSSTGNLKIDIDSDNNQTDRTFQITSDGSSKTLFQAKEGGDISFYDDTGVSQSFFWDASAESLGIGTTSPSAPLTVQGGTASAATIQLKGGVNGNDNASIHSLYSLKLKADSSEAIAGREISFAVGATDAMTIDSSGNLLVGDTSTVPFDGTSGVLIGGARTSLAFATTGHTHKMLYSVNTGTAGLHFYDSTNNRTDMIWDNSGNLLVGTASTSIPNQSSNTGIFLFGGGSINVARSGSECAIFNRLTSPGEIVRIQKDGATIGSIGVGAVSDYLAVGNSNTSIQFYASGIAPATGSLSTLSSNTKDLGSLSVRWRDLFIGNDISHLDAAGNARLLYDKSANLLGNAGTNGTFATLSKSSGSFKIDHPLPEKTETHYLVHSFVESPQANNIYRGKVDLVDGLAAVNIDDAAGMTEGTYVLLNTNTQCFTSNESGWTAVKGSVSGNILTITAQDNTCTDTISWMVIGERHDQHMLDTEWTDENGKVIVEPLKES